MALELYKVFHILMYRKALPPVKKFCCVKFIYSKFSSLLLGLLTLPVFSFDVRMSMALVG